jgi:multidrug resistance efflux pump
MWRRRARCVRIEVDETDIGRLRIGMPAKLTGDAFGGGNWRRGGEIQAGRQAGQGSVSSRDRVIRRHPERAPGMART